MVVGTILAYMPQSGMLYHKVATDRDTNKKRDDIHTKNTDKQRAARKDKEKTAVPNTLAALDLALQHNWLYIDNYLFIHTRNNSGRANPNIDVESVVTSGWAQRLARETNTTVDKR